MIRLEGSQRPFYKSFCSFLVHSCPDDSYFPPVRANLFCHGFGTCSGGLGNIIDSYCCAVASKCSGDTRTQAVFSTGAGDDGYFACE